MATQWLYHALCMTTAANKATADDALEAALNEPDTTPYIQPLPPPVFDINTMSYVQPIPTPQYFWCPPLFTASQWAAFEQDMGGVWYYKACNPWTTDDHKRDILVADLGMSVEDAAAIAANSEGKVILLATNVPNAPAPGHVFQSEAEAIAAFAAEMGV